MNQNLLQSFFRILNCFLDKYIDREIVKITAEDIVKLEDNIKNILIFSLVCSVGASTDYEGRGKFNEKMRMTLAQKGYPLLQKSYYDFYFNEKAQSFE